MCDLYDSLRERVRHLHSVGVTPDKIVVPGDEWDRIKSQAEVRKGEGVAGGDKTLIEGTKVKYNNRNTSAEVIIKVSTDE